MKVFTSLALGCVLFLGSRAAAGEAIPAYTPGDWLALYAPGGAGFAFVPKARMAVNALGYLASSLSGAPYQVTLWNTQGSRLASALVTANSSLFNQSRYEAINPVVLNAGQTYYLGAAGTNGYWVGYEIRDSSLPPGSFSVAPDLSYVGEALGTNLSGSFPSQVGSTNNLYLGPNFQYSAGAFILLTGIQVQTNQAQVRFTVQGAASKSFTLLQAASLTNAWTTNRNAVLSTNAGGSSYTFTAPVSGPVQFYRVQTP